MTTTAGMADYVVGFVIIVGGSLLLLWTIMQNKIRKLQTDHEQCDNEVYRTICQALKFDGALTSAQVCQLLTDSLRSEKIASAQGVNGNGQLDRNSQEIALEEVQKVAKEVSQDSVTNLLKEPNEIKGPWIMPDDKTEEMFALWTKWDKEDDRVARCKFWKMVAEQFPETKNRTTHFAEDCATIICIMDGKAP